jgi:hypothetical protein
MRPGLAFADLGIFWQRELDHQILDRFFASRMILSEDRPLLFVDML